MCVIVGLTTVDKLEVFYIIYIYIANMPCKLTDVVTSSDLARLESFPLSGLEAVVDCSRPAQPLARQCRSKADDFESLTVSVRADDDGSPLPLSFVLKTGTALRRHSFVSLSNVV